DDLRSTERTAARRLLVAEVQTIDVGAADEAGDDVEALHRRIGEGLRVARRYDFQNFQLAERPIGGRALTAGTARTNLRERVIAAEVGDRGAQQNLGAGLVVEAEQFD